MFENSSIRKRLLLNGRVRFVLGLSSKNMLSLDRQGGALTLLAYFDLQYFSGVLFAYKFLSGIVSECNQSFYSLIFCLFTISILLFFNFGLYLL